MNGTISADHQDFRSAVADVRRAADRLRDDRCRVAREVDALLAGGWTGVAATAYAEAWDDWLRAADGVLRGLVAMGDLLEAAHVDLVAGDLGSRADLDAVAARIGARLG